MEEKSVERSGARAGSTGNARRLARSPRMDRAGRGQRAAQAHRQAGRRRRGAAAIAYLATRGEDAPALLFDEITGDRTGASILINMLGSSKERYALAVGLDPSLSTAEMIAATRDIMQRRIKPVPVAERRRRSTRSSCAATRSTSRNFRCRSSGRATAAATLAPATSPSRAIPTPAASMSASTGRCCMARDASASIVRPASTA